jgi:uncharacterized protein YbjT (DUF2867 family)
MASIFITGASGYLGQALVRMLCERRHTVRALVRRTGGALPAACEQIVGDPLRGETFADRIAPSDTFVQLVGAPRPAPWKGPQFRAIDLVSGRVSIAAARAAGVRHFVYVSVAQPAPIMHAYLAVRAECEALLRASGMAATILRPWYVLGPGHWWPLALLPMYRLLERIPATAAGATRLGLVTHAQMVSALAWAVEHPPDGVRVMEVPDIRAGIGKR